VETNPYAPPAAALDLSAPAPSERGGFRSVTGLAQAITWVMTVMVVLDVLALANGWLGSDPAAVLRRGWVIAFSVAAARVLAGVLFAVFLARATRNAQTFGALTLRYTPGWAAASLFVPFMNIYAPYLAMRDIWQASDPERRRSALVSWWWGLFLAYYAFGAIRFHDLAFGLSMTAAVLAIAVVRGVARLQDQRQRELVEII
jgi:hypothetical protein